MVVNLVLEVRTHGTVWRLPVPEAQTIVLWVAAEVDDDAHEQKADKRDNLDATEPELKLSENADAEQIDRKDWGRHQDFSPLTDSCDLLKTIKITRHMPHSQC